VKVTRRKTNSKKFLLKTTIRKQNSIFFLLVICHCLTRRKKIVEPKKRVFLLAGYYKYIRLNLYRIVTAVTIHHRRNSILGVQTLKMKFQNQMKRDFNPKFHALTHNQQFYGNYSDPKYLDKYTV